MQPLLNIAVNAARLAGEFINRSLDQLDRVQINIKNGTSRVSNIDIKAEQLIINTIHKAYPNHGFLAEESGLHQTDSDCVWIIDPLDGTNNFLHGFPYFAVSIALQIKGSIEHAVVYDPTRHECFAASRGRGARLNDKRIRVSKQTQLSGAMIGSNFPHKNHSLEQMHSLEHALTGPLTSFRHNGAASLDLAYVACGRLDGFYSMELNSWDMAAGCLLIQEAGGLISDFRGNEHHLEKGELVTGTPKLFKNMLQVIQPVTKQW